MPVGRMLFDPAIRSAWRRVARLWRPMAVWTLLVWAVFGVILGPLSSWALSHQFLRADHPVVGNEELFTWALTPAGLVFVLLSGGLALVGSVVRFAGLFQMVTDDLEGRPVSVRSTVLQVAQHVPALFKLCVAAVAAIGVLAVPLFAGLAGVYAIFLREHDINYYLAVRPAAWHQALAAAAAWGAAWGFAAIYIVIRSLPALPAYLDGHRPLSGALRRAWLRTRKCSGRLLKLIAVSAGVWLLVRAGLDAVFFAVASLAVEWVAAASQSLRPIVLVTAGFVGCALVVDAVISFLGFSHVATVLTKFYYEDTSLHAEAPSPASLWMLPRHVVQRLRVWLRLTRLLPLVAFLMGGSFVASGILLNRIPAPQRVVITAHRAGMHLAPENTLAALRRSIEAGADYAEIDVQLTRDGIPVVVHDADFMRVAGDPRRVAESDYAAIADLVQGPPDAVDLPEERRVATLDEFLFRARGRIGLNIELKYYGWDSRLAEEVIRRVRARQMDGHVVIMSRNLEAIRQVRRIAPEIATGYLTAVAVGDLRRLPIRFVAVARRKATARLIRSVQAHGIDVHVWTLNRPGSMVDVVERGANGIITDNPALGVRVRDELEDLSAASRLLLRFRRLLVDEQEAGTSSAD